MKNREDVLLDQATQAMRESQPEPGQISTAAEKVAQRLGVRYTEGAEIASCDDMRPLLVAYKAGQLPESRALLVEAHLRECGVCLRRFHS